MSGDLICSVITPHTPRMADEDSAPDFVRGMIAGSKELGAHLRAMKPDVFIVNSTHWVSTFNWYATTHEVHEGLCVADEAPDMIPGVPYRYNGDPAFAGALIAAISGLDLPCFVNETPHFQWDYANYVPLHYIDPDAEIPVVLIPTCLSADLEECRRVGREIARVAADTGRRAVFIASTALSHAVIRGPELWPTEERQQLDFKLLDMLEQDPLEEVIAWLPDYCRGAVAEMGGRPLSALLGTMESFAGQEVESQRFGPYGQSSGSGNMSVAFWHS